MDADLAYAKMQLKTAEENAEQLLKKWLVANEALELAHYKLESAQIAESVLMTMYASSKLYAEKLRETVAGLTFPDESEIAY